MFYSVGGSSCGESSVMSLKLQRSKVTVIGVVGDPGQTSNTVDTLKHLMSGPAQFGVIVGDLSYADSDQPRWDSWRDEMSQDAAGLAWATQMGNHEVRFGG